MYLNLNKLIMTRNILVVFSFLVALLSGCDKFRNNDDLVTFEFRLLDESGRPSTEFSFEEKITFSFLIINNSADNLFLSEMGGMEHFFEVFKIKDSGELVSFGKPYEAIFCVYVGGCLLNSGDTIPVSISWIPDPDTYPGILCGPKYTHIPLPAGKYRTSASPSCTFQKGGEDFISTKTSLQISFQIIP
jgi:hypothetical protein